MTIFIADISSFQHGLDLRNLGDCAGIFAKVTEGTYYVDADYNGWRVQAQQLGKVFVAYDFVRADETADAQAAWIAEHIGDKSLPLMLDVETEGASKPSFPQVVALIRACIGEGLRPKLAYIPHWYWQQIGSPDMTELNALGVGLISSAYPGGAGDAAHLYPGDNASGWASYGGVTPLLYQFTDAAADGGMHLDMNAFRGSAADLARSLGSGAPTEPVGGPIVGNIPPSIAQRFPDIAGEFPPNAPFNDETALIWADARAAAAALYAAQARDNSGQARDAANGAQSAAGATRDAVNALAAQLGGFMNGVNSRLDAIEQKFNGLAAGGATVDAAALAKATARELAADLTKGSA